MTDFDRQVLAIARDLHARGVLPSAAAIRSRHPDAPSIYRVDAARGGLIASGEWPCKLRSAKGPGPDRYKAHEAGHEFAAGVRKIERARRDLREWAAKRKGGAA